MVTHVVTFRYWRGPRFEQVPAPLKVAFVGTLDECLELRAECERDFVGGGLEVRRCDREVSWYWLHGFEGEEAARPVFRFDDAQARGRAWALMRERRMSDLRLIEVDEFFLRSVILDRSMCS